jgi:hypothetical protein
VSAAHRTRSGPGADEQADRPLVATAGGAEHATVTKTATETVTTVTQCHGRPGVSGSSGYLDH